MALPKLYEQITWVNNTTPALNEDNLNAMSQAIDDIDDRVIDLAGTIMEDVPQIIEDMEILEPAIENIDENVARAESAAESAEQYAEEIAPPIEVVKDYADIITVEDAINKAAKDVKVKVEAVQDLHGYTKPWVGGAGKNKLPLGLATIKSMNTDGTWTGNSYAWQGITYTVLMDSDGNITGINTNGTASARGWLFLCQVDFGSTGFEFFDRTIDGYTYSGAYEQDKKTIFFNGQSKKTYILIDNGQQCNNLVFYPQRELGSQATSFEPYTNICPITGSTGANINRTGGNLFNNTASTTTVNSGKFTVNSDKTVTVSETFTAWSQIVLGDNMTFKSGTYVFSGAADNNNVYLNLYDLTTSSNVADLKTGIASVTLDSSHSYRLRLIVSSAQTVNNLVFKPMISVSAMEYAPYEGTLYTISFGDTYYLAELDVTSGVLTVIGAYADLSTLEWSLISGGRWQNITTPIKKGTGDTEVLADFICDSFQTLSNDGLIASDYGIAAHSSGAIRCKNGSTVDTPTGHIVYPLQTPTTVQLTPTEVYLLYGYNTLFGDCGDISLTYDASGVLRIANAKLDIDTFKSIVAASSDFADFKTRVAAL